MPRVADHDQRRAQLAVAALDIAAENGLDEVTVARVAAVAGFSVGLVQHYFPSKRELMAKAYELTLQRAFARVDDAVDAGESAGDPIRVTLLAALRNLLPLDAASRAECLVRGQFQGRATVDASLAQVAEQARRDLLRQIGQALDNGRECGETDPELVTMDAAWELLLLTEGFAGVLLGQASAPAAAVLSATVSRMLPHPCGRLR